LPGELTKTVTLVGNLSAQAIGPLAQVLTSATPLTVVPAPGSPALLTSTLNSLTDNQVPYVAGDNILLQGTTTTGATVNATVAVGPTTTVGDVINAINTNFPGSTATLDASGNIVVTANSTGPSKLNFTISDATGNTGATSWSNHNPVTTVAGKNGDSVSSAIQFYDSQGTPHDLTLTFTKDATNNTWDMTGTISAADGTIIDGSVQNIVFNDDGSFRSVNGSGLGDPFMTFKFPQIATPQTIGFNFGSPNGFNGLTEFGGASSAAATSQDGFAAGQLVSLSVGQDGTLSGVFTNGRTLPIAQLAMATFPNPGGLDRQGNNYFDLTAQSGSPNTGAGLSGGRGAIIKGSLEPSNVDTAAEFTQLIVAQRGFQVNAETITVSSQVLETLANIIR
jgi:flagellar hook protein FlgE